MSTEMEPTRGISEQELLEAFNQKAYGEKKREQKERNELSNTAQDMNAFKQLITLLQQCEKARVEAQNTTDMEVRKIYEAKVSAFNDAIKEYYLEKKEAAEQSLADYPNKDLTQKMGILDAILKNLKSKRDVILDNWTSPNNSQDDKNLWVGKTWEQGVVNQAEYYANKNDANALAHVNETIAEIERAGIPLTEAEKKQLMDARENALRTFREQLALTQQENSSDIQLQIKFAGLILNTSREMDEVIDLLNKTRAPETQLPKQGLSKAKAIKFANETGINDINQMIFNIENFLILKEMDRLEKSVDIMKNEVSAEKNATLIMHCELTTTSPAPYDPDNGSRFALQPQPFSSNNYSILKQACDTVNGQTNGEPLIIHKQQGRNIDFEYNNERFSFNTGSTKFSADNIHPKTFDKMMEVYNQIYKGSEATLKCDGPVSKNLCAAGVERAGMSNVQVMLESGRPAAEKQNIAAAKQEEKVQQNMTASRRI